MQGNREGGAKTFLRLGPEGNREGRAKTFPTFRASTKCKEIGKARQRLSLRLEPALNAGK